MKKQSPPPFARMPWYPRDFASSTRTWPFSARGVYRELLDAQWDLGGSQPGILPDDPDQLRELARVPEPDWKVAWRFVAGKFPKIEGGGRQNARLEEHRQMALREFEARRKGAQKTNAKRWAGQTATENPSVNGSHGPSLSDSLSESDSDS
jgi:uncharacterized protein YdaU (DUF1376 family)